MLTLLRSAIANLTTSIEPHTPIMFGLPLLLATLIGCNDDPSAVGDGLIGGDLEARVLTIPAEEITFTSGIAAVSNSSSELNEAVLVGSSDDGTMAHGLLSIVTDASRLQGVTPSDILDARLRLRTLSYRYQDGSPTTSFDVVAFDGTFGSTEQFSSGLVDRLDAGEVLASYSQGLPDTANVSIQLDATAAADFLSGYLRLDTIVGSDGNQTVQRNVLKSIGLRARTGGGTIGSFLGATSREFADSLLPALIVTLADTVLTLEIGVSNWVAKAPDDFQTGAGVPAVMGGAPIRTLVKFSVDSIPLDALILQAELTLTAEEDSEMVGTSDQIDNTILLVAGDNPIGSTDQLASYPTSFGARFIPGFREALDSTQLVDEFRFPGLNTPITEWLKYRRTGGTSGFANNGLIIALGRSLPDLESASVDRVRFYGSDGPIDKRPRLVITYAVPVESSQ